MTAASAVGAWWRVLPALCVGLTIYASAGCRFGRAPGDGLGNAAVVAPVEQDAGAEGELLPPENGPVELPATATGSSGAAGAAAPSKPSTTSASGGSPVKPSASPGPAKPNASADSCSKRDKIEVCDPISNIGCLAELGMQCDIDLLATTPTGACVFSAPPPDPKSCLAIFPTESCPPQSTCIEGICQKICLCDGDCDATESCTMQLGATAFKACKPR